ncbi:MAG: uncharacterized protein KVP18_003692 [Porospora cf. gigantea A]|nr:MAG: hypothetical protein KVP18_003692 [Porospora cf. gigantea A]
MQIKSRNVTTDAFIGCSIAVNGVCLTVTSFNATGFTADVAEETARRSNLGHLRPGDPVHLERALKADGRNGGHYVQGHVDATGEIADKWQDSEAVWLKIRVGADVGKYLVPKGFVAVDGASLTMVDVGRSYFTLMLVPHTQDLLLLADKAKGAVVNVEVDVMAKYAEKLLSFKTPSLYGQAMQKLDRIEQQQARSLRRPAAEKLDRIKQQLAASKHEPVAEKLDRIKQQLAARSRKRDTQPS